VQTRGAEGVRLILEQLLVAAASCQVKDSVGAVSENGMNLVGGAMMTTVSELIYFSPRVTHFSPVRIL